MGLPLADYAKVEARAKELAAQKVRQMAMELSPEQARQALALWAKSGGRINPLVTPASHFTKDDLDRAYRDAIKDAWGGRAEVTDGR